MDYHKYMDESISIEEAEKEAHELLEFLRPGRQWKSNFFHISADDGHFMVYFDRSKAG